ncbi:helix-turn-helix transcriptional regulator [Caenimonas sp. SL110]|uniref:helix-turn-helix transcriptional regulator n=1 Tax=Caenimonas sp. SL110 TaxID=1450524 RepID=UPI000653C4C9|nr:helix-turn-helix domain-containing protein [Caenimonas sp. SL110]
MPAAAQLHSVLDRQLLIQLGERLRRARKSQGLTAVALAERAGVSRMTLSSVEAGQPAPTMGTYLRVLSALGLSGDLALVASGELGPQAPSAATTKVVLPATNARHDIQDLQSLMLHEEAIKLAKKHPELIERALATLEKWRASGDAHSRVLWDEWSVILRRREWRRALARTRRSMELRQASPLTLLLPPATRARILEDVSQLKQAVTLGHLSAPSSTRRQPARAKK